MKSPSDDARLGPRAPPTTRIHQAGMAWYLPNVDVLMPFASTSECKQFNPKYLPPVLSARTKNFFSTRIHLIKLRLDAGDGRGRRGAHGCKERVSDSNLGRSDKASRGSEDQVVVGQSKHVADAGFDADTVRAHSVRNAALGVALEVGELQVGALLVGDQRVHVEAR